jgi:CopG family transcriptional regulator / antitoxin EndoAI
MSNVTVNIAFNDVLLKEIDREAKREAKNRSELLREAARLYIQRQRKWDNVFRLGQNLARKNSLTPEDVTDEIDKYRIEKHKPATWKLSVTQIF